MREKKGTIPDEDKKYLWAIIGLIVLLAVVIYKISPSGFWSHF